MMTPMHVNEPTRKHTSRGASFRWKGRVAFAALAVLFVSPVRYADAAPGDVAGPALDWSYSQRTILPGPSDKLAFGKAVALSGDGKIALIGGKNVAYLFLAGPTGWTQHQTLAAPLAGGDFGSAVALSKDGNTAIVGAREESQKKGAAYVFIRTAGQPAWNQQPVLWAPGGQQGDEFGASVALSANGHLALVGAPLKDGVGADKKDRGAVYLFSRSGSAWHHAQTVDGDCNFCLGGSQNVGSSIAVSADASAWATGAPGYDWGWGPGNEQGTQIKAPNSGGVSFYRRGTATWTLAEWKASWQVEANDVPHPLYAQAHEGARWGASVAISGAGDRAALGAPGDAGNLGRAYLGPRTAEGGWGPYSVAASGGVIGVGLPPAFGQTVALAGDGSIVVVGSPGNDGAAVDQGSAYIFKPVRNGPNGNLIWPQTQQLNASNAAAGGLFGSAVALSTDGTVGIVGAPGASSQQGAVYVLERKLQPPSKAKATPKLTP